MIGKPAWTIDYQALLADSTVKGLCLAEFLRAELPDVWLAAYADATQRPLNVMVFPHGTFEYLYDDYATLEATGVVSADRLHEARLVAAIGLSAPQKRGRDDGRLRGWVGPTGATFGDGWDKGHFIGHAIGGAVDGLEANVFLQRSAVNRGPYREMERYCAANPGVLCFSRPIYGDFSARPSAVEFGILRTSGELWIQQFDNR